MTNEEHETKKHIQAINEAVKGKTHLVHGVFHYQCVTCKLIKPVYLGYGVEGPLELKDKHIASPFGGHPCDLCKGDTSHIFFGLDQRFSVRTPPAGAFVYCIPSEGLDITAEFSSMFMGTHFIAGR